MDLCSASEELMMFHLLVDFASLFCVNFMPEADRLISIEEWWKIVGLITIRDSNPVLVCGKGGKDDVCDGTGIQKLTVA